MLDKIVVKANDDDDDDWGLEDLAEALGSTR